MIQWTVTKRGLAREELDEPPLRSPRVRVRVRYAGAGFADAMATEGGYVLAPRRPFSPGYEFMGTVESTTPRWAKGTRVIGLLPAMGAFRSVLDVPDAHLVAIPDEVSDTAAAALPLNVMTAAALIEKSARLQRGQSFLIVGGAGGVGQACLAWARWRGLTAYATAAPAKASLIERLGAVPLDSSGDWPAQLRRLRAEGVDAAFDAFGLPSLSQSWSVLGARGTLVAFGFSPSVRGGRGPFVRGLAFLAGKALIRGRRRVTMCGAPRVSARDPRWYHDTLSAALQALAQGQWPLNEPRVVDERETLALMNEFAKRTVTGKALLSFSD